MTFSNIVKAISLVAEYVEKHKTSLETEYKAARELVEQISKLFQEEPATQPNGRPRDPTSPDNGSNGSGAPVGR